MKKIIAASALVLAFAAAAQADEYVNGYTRRDGTYVQPHYRTSPNSTTLDNYSTRGNTNPYTGERGYNDPFPATTSPSPFGTQRQQRGR